MEDTASPFGFSRVTDVKRQSLRHSLDSKDHHLVCLLYKRFRNILCHIFLRCTGTHHCPIKYGSYSTPADLK